MNIPRLDLMIYAHDGRGLGHASRSVAIGMAVRRLFPSLKVLFISGATESGSLIGNAPLDWIKLPSYKTTVIDGKSNGVSGDSNYSDSEAGILRAQMIRDIVCRYRPRTILADHSPQGKHKELIPAIKASRDFDTNWILGVRGVVGGVAQVKSAIAQSIFKNHYQHILWYGDSTVLGIGALNLLKERFGTLPHETGYVSRLSEWTHWQEHSNFENRLEYDITISIPWFGEHTETMLSNLAKALVEIKPEKNGWRIFVGFGENAKRERKIRKLFSDIDYCKVLPAGDSYPITLMKSSSAIIYGGYNSLSDILYSGKPAVVLLRNMKDNEQIQHITKLNHSKKINLIAIEEQLASSGRLADAIEKLQNKTMAANSGSVNMKGAENAGLFIGKVVGDAGTKL